MPSFAYVKGAPPRGGKRSRGEEVAEPPSGGSGAEAPSGTGAAASAAGADAGACVRARVVPRRRCTQFPSPNRSRLPRVPVRRGSTSDAAAAAGCDVPRGRRGRPCLACCDPRRALEHRAPRGGVFCCRCVPPLCVVVAWGLCRHPRPSPAQCMTPRQRSMLLAPP